MLRTLSRWLLVAAQCTTLALTWPLWLCRDDLPPIQSVKLPDVDAGPVLLASLGLVLLPDVLRLLGRRAPRSLAPAGIAAHAAVLVLAMVQDELRVQPQVLIPAMLLFATLPGPGARVVGLGVLAAQWGWAGAHKLLSERYVEAFGPPIVGELLPGLSDTAMHHTCIAIAVGELAMGLAVVAIPFTRLRAPRIALTGGAAMLHLGIVVSLAGIDHNPSVWPWNVAVAGVAACLLLDRDHARAAELRRARWPAWSFVVSLAVVPAGFYWGLTHPYLGFVLYSGNAPRAHVHAPDGSRSPMSYISDLESFVPPTHRNFREMFRHRGRPGEILVIQDVRTWARRTGRDRVVLRSGDRSP